MRWRAVVIDYLFTGLQEGNGYIACVHTFRVAEALRKQGQ